MAAVARCLQPSPALIITCATHVQHLCISEKRPAYVVYYARLSTAQDSFWPTPGLGYNCTSAGTWYKENGELKLHAYSCKETVSPVTQTIQS